MTDNSGMIGKRVVVIGAARSGMAAARLFHRHGASVFVSDAGPEHNLAHHIAELKGEGIEAEAGGHSPRVFEADLMVISPGVPSSSDVVRGAEQRDIRIVSELEAASWFCPAPIIAVTGSNGKTTTATLIGRMLHDAKIQHIVAGNIGTPLSSVISEIVPGTTVVLEVSSFQLDHIESFHPHVSVLLNITPDHLDRYGGSFDRYIAAKCRIFENQSNSDYLVYCRDDAETTEQVHRLASMHVHALPYGVAPRNDEGAFTENGMLVTRLSGKRDEVIGLGEISIKGIHNQFNAMAATLAVQLAGASVPSIRGTLRNFKGVEHRLEFVRETAGVRYVNDSKATNVDSVWFALQAFDEPVVLLLGGRDKGNDYSKLDDLVRQRVRTIVAIGESAGTVEQHFGSIAHLVTAGSMEEAVRLARKFARSGDVVLLSPACASFDWFDNYEHRGKVFKDAVGALEK